MTTDIRIGDRFKPVGKVIESSMSSAGKGSIVRFFGSDKNRTSTDVWIPHDILLASERIERPIAEGDRVRVKNGHNCGKVIAVDGDEAWVRWDNGNRFINSIANLEPALGVSMEGGE